MSKSTSCHPAPSLCTTHTPLGSENGGILRLDGGDYGTGLVVMAMLVALHRAVVLIAAAVAVKSALQ